MLTTLVPLSGSECWPHLCILDQNIGHTCAFWIRMLATPMLLSESECWPQLCFCLDPNVGHTYAFWIRMLATPMLLSGSECWPHPCHWIRMLVMPVSLPGSQCRMLMKERKIRVETVEIAFHRSCQRTECDGPWTWWKYWRNIGRESWKCHNKYLLKEMARIFGKNEYRILRAVSRYV